MKTYVLYNSKSDNGKGGSKARKVVDFWKEKELVFIDIFTLHDYKEFFSELQPDDEICICGGDGTLHHFVNDAYAAGFDNSNKVYLYPTGTGNDFYTDIEKHIEDGPALINKYIVDLPTVIINGKRTFFINGVGFGIDGYCCEVGDRMREESPGKEINYTSIAVNGLLFHYKPTLAEITVDGKKEVFKKAWLAPTMNGRYYGGGMMAAPGQYRLNPERTVTTMVMFGKGKIKTLIAFPSIFQGNHVNKIKMVRTFTGKSVRVKFDRPVSLQIDGETVLNVTEYSVETPPSRLKTVPPRRN